MKKFLFIATIVALILGTSVNVDAKRKVRKKQQNVPTKQTTKAQNNVAVEVPGTGERLYTQPGAERLENGDVSDLEMARIQLFYGQYVFPGTVANKSYFPYVKTFFTQEALDMLKGDDGEINWDPIFGKANGGEGFTPAYQIQNLGNGIYVVEEGNSKCYFEVKGSDGNYKITKVSTKPLN
ncbi:MAG: hypothetical protein IKX31_02360 [Muribaculaceae bacterium]|nr:hypothetical protein [Muribaculaceae bacterium]